MSCKAQAHTQVFIYVLSIIIVSVILLYGYRAIAHFGDKAEQVSYIKFKTDLESVVRVIGPDYGSVKRVEFSLGDNYKEVCFVDSDVSSKAEIPTAHPVIQEIVDSGKENTFLLSNNVEHKFDVGKIEVSGNIICIESRQGRFRIEFEGLGDRAEIREWTY